MRTDRSSPKAEPGTTATRASSRRNFREVVGAADGLARRRPFGRSRPRRRERCRRRPRARRGRSPAGPRAGDDELAPPAEGLEHAADEGGARLEGREGGALGDRGRVGRHLALEVDAGLHEGLGPREVADAPARHRVGLGHAVHQDRPLRERGDGRGARVRPTRIVDVLVDLVADHPHARPALEDGREGLELARCE